MVGPGWSGTGVWISYALTPSMARNVAKLTRFLLEWAADPNRRAVVRDANLSVLTTALRDPAGTPRVITRSQGYGTWLCGSGQARVLSGDTGGWAEFRSGVALMRAGLMLAFHVFKRAKPPGRTEPCAPLAAAHAVALCFAFRDPRAEELGTLHCCGWPAGCRVGDYPAFMQALAAMAMGSESTARPGSPYADVLANWNSPDLTATLVAALDYHLLRTSSRGDDLAEFEDIPVLAFPAEVFAVLAVRRDLGLPEPKLDHPLLATPLGRGWLDGVPATPLPDDPLLSSVQALADGAR